MAGVTVSRIQQMLGIKQIARCMPNLAARYGMAAIALCFHPESTELFRVAARSIVAALGTRYEMPERLFAAHIGVSGSAIAYLFQCVHALALGGVRAGLPYAMALDIAVRTLEGAAAALRSGAATGNHIANPIELLSQVASPGGTTIEGIVALAEGHFDATIIDAVTRAAERAQELERYPDE